MGHLLSVSRRTDVAALHSRWFRARVRAGFSHVVHPYTGRVARVSWRPEDVLGLQFWTRWPGPLLDDLGALRRAGYRIAVQFTITPYGPPLESHNPPRARALAAAERVAHELGEDALLWRYDPILLASDWDEARHRREFGALARDLRGLTRRCTFSFVDFYGKTSRNLAPLETARGEEFVRPDVERQRALARELAALAADVGMSFVSCCDDALLGEAVGRSRCLDPAVFRALGADVDHLPAAPTRPDCGCVKSIDVGTYSTCSLGCAYCYAVTKRPTALRRLRECDPEDSLLWRPPSLRGVDLDARAASPGADRAGT